MKQRRSTMSTDEQLRVTLPLPPSINEQYYTDTRGNRRLTPVALRYKAEVQRALLNLKQQGILNAPLVKRMRTYTSRCTLSATSPLLSSETSMAA